ncbi:MAG: hypothetical protein ACTSQA_07670 [Candidatus Heimdallarchaeaceae archaeon]
MLAVLKAQNKERKAQVLNLQAQAHAETAGIRGALTGTGMKVIAGLALVSVALGVIQWISQMNTQVNTARKNTRELRDEIRALNDPLSTLKTSFTSVSDIVEKITKNFPELTDKFNEMRDPAEKLGLAFSVVAENAAKADKWTFSWKKIFSSSGEWTPIAPPAPRGDWSFQTSYTGNIRATVKEIKEQSAALHELFTFKDEDYEKTQLLDALMGAHNKTIKDNLKNVDGLTAAYKKWKNEIVDTASAAALIEITEKYNDIIEASTKRLEEASTATQRLSAEKLLLIAIENRSRGIEKVKKDFSDMLDTAFESLSKSFEEAAEDKPITWLEYYTQMYEIYGNISKKDASYTQAMTKYKELLTTALKKNIKELKKEISMINVGTDAWKNKNIELAKSIEQLTRLNELMDKLNEKATWFNIPSAIIKPTASQLTGATVYLTNEFNIAGKASEEDLALIQDVVTEGINQANNAQMGNTGGALG